MPLLLKLPEGAVQAEHKDLFTEGEDPKIILGVKYLYQRGSVYMEMTTADHTNAQLLFSDVKMGWIYIIK